MTAPSRPDAAVLIVNYNSGAWLARAVDALARQSVKGFRIVVVDNDSRDGSAEGIEGRAENLVLIRAGSNLGFAAGNNLALRHAGDARWIVLLNPDAFPEPEWLERFLQAAEAAPDCAFFGCRMLMADVPGRLDGTGDMYHASGASWRRDHGVRVDEGSSASGEIFGPCAAAALYARQALDEVGGFDERYFCYHEDVDLAFRLRLRGYRCAYVPQAVVAHVGSGITGKRSDFATYYGHRNLVWTYVKNMPAALLWLFLPLHIAMSLVAIAVGAARGQLGVMLRAKRDALRDLGAVLGQRRAIQRERRAGTAALLSVMHFGWRRR